MSDKVVISYHDSLLRESDLRLLQGRNWLNDSLISFWFEHLRHDVFGAAAADLLFVSAELTQLLKMGDPSELPIFLDPLDMRHKRLAFFPVNDSASSVSSGGSHWSLLVFSKNDGKWFHYDSQRGSNYCDARCLAQRINAYLGAAEPAPLVDAQCTQQDNSYDCGAFVMIYAQRLAEMAEKGLDISQCFVQRLDANDVRLAILSLINDLRTAA